MRFLALGGVAGPLLFTGVLILCAAHRPDYSHANQFISELGAKGTQNAAIMNFAGFVPSGILIAALGVSLAHLIPGGRLTIVGSALIGVFGVGLVVAGLVPCQPGCPQATAALHDGVSVVAFVSCIAGTALFARIFYRLRSARAFSFYSALSSVVAAGCLVALVNSLDSGFLTGLWQRLLVATLFLWSCVVGLHTFRSSN